MTIENELRSLVLVHASFDDEKNFYYGALDNEAIFHFERSFNQLLLKRLLQDGPDRDAIEKNFYILSNMFQSNEDSSLELKWIEQQLASESVPKNALQMLTLSYHKLIKPERFKNIEFKQISSREDLSIWLKIKKNQARNYNEMSLYDSMLKLLVEIEDYFDETGKIKNAGLRKITAFFPIAIVSIGTITCIEPLLAVYAFYFIILKGGQLLGRSSSNEVESLGQNIKSFSKISAAMTTTILLRVVEMIFWSSNQCFRTSCQIGEMFFKSNKPELLVFQDSLENDLLKASENSHTGMSFKHFQLKIIALPLEAHRNVIGQQYFHYYRKGNKKSEILERFLVRIKNLDEQDTSLENKLSMLAKTFNALQANSSIYVPGSGSALAINKAREFLEFLQKHPEFGIKEEEVAPMITQHHTECEVIPDYLCNTP